MESTAVEARLDGSALEDDGLTVKVWQLLAVGAGLLAAIAAAVAAAGVWALPAAVAGYAFAVAVFQAGFHVSETRPARIGRRMRVSLRADDRRTTIGRAFLSSTAVRVIARPLRSVVGACRGRLESRPASIAVRVRLSLWIEKRRSTIVDLAFGVGGAVVIVAVNWLLINSV